MNAEPLSDRRLGDLSQLGCRFLAGTSIRCPTEEILVIRFSGTYREGSAGNPDGRFMAAMITAAFEAWQSPTFILDLTELDYRWGDGLEGVLYRVPHWWDAENCVRALVVGERCKKAVSTLLSSKRAYSCTEEEWIFDAFDAAWRYVEDKLAAS